MSRLKLWIGTGLTMATAACSPPQMNPLQGSAYEPIPEVELPQKRTDGTQTELEPENVEPLMPCAAWDQVSNRAPAAGEAAFNIIETVAIKTIDNVPTVVGTHRLSMLPQVMYVLSREKAAKDGLAKILIDPPNIEEFMVLARQKCAAKEVSQSKCFALEALYSGSKYNSALKKELLSQRNTAIMEEAEKQLPGVFLGTANPLEKSLLMQQFMASANIDRITPTNVGELEPLVRRVPLFPSDSWTDRRVDLDRALETLTRYANRTNLTLKERACRFALTHRVMAQALTIKGIGGVPTLKSTGWLADLPTADVALFPTSDRKGVYNNVVTEEWLLDQVANPTVRPARAASTENLISALRYFAALAGHRSPDLWILKDTITGDPETVPLGTIKLETDLLRLGVGWFGATAKIFAAEELYLLPNNHIETREDTADNLARVAYLALEMTERFKGLETPNVLEQQILTEEQLGEFTAPYPIGVHARFQMLLTGLVFEGLNRMRAGQGNDNLKLALRYVGRRIGNTMVEDLE